MKCHDVEELMDRYLDRELADSTARELELHLRDCEHCRNEFGALIEFLSPEKSVTVPDGLRERIVIAIDGKVSHNRRWVGRMIRIGAAAALIGLVVLIGRVVNEKQDRQTVVEKRPLVVMDDSSAVPPNPWVAAGIVQSLVGSGGMNPGCVLVHAMTMEQVTSQIFERASQPLVRIRYRAKVKEPVIRDVPISGVDLTFFALFNRL